MADLKISQLNSIVTVVPATDVLPVVQGGTTLKITPKQILESGSPATLASATITGDLTVDTSTLKVDSTNNRVGIATATPGVRVDIVSDSNTSLAPVLRVNSNNVAVSTSLAYDGLIGSSTLTIQSGTSAAMIFNTNNVNERYRIASDGVATWSNVGGVAGTAMTLNSTGLGIGVAPITSYILSCAGPVSISGTNSGTRTSYITNSGACAIYYTDGGGSGYFTDFGNLIIQPRTSADRSVVIATGSTTPVERAVVKSTGQVRFVPLAADPAGAESGDVYYNSSSNKLKCYNGTTWNDLF